MGAEETIGAMSTVMSVSASVVALAALGVSVWQGMETRRHNRRSVRPHLTYYTFFDGVKAFSGIELSNNGVGPAIIDSFALFVDGERITERRAGGWPAALARLQLGPGLTYNWLDKDDGVRVGESVWLIGIEAGCAPEQEEALRRALCHLRIQIGYRTVYEERSLLLIPEQTERIGRA